MQKWLKEEVRKGHKTPFLVIDITENNIAPFQDELKLFIAKQILTHLEDVEQLKQSYYDEDPKLLEEHINNYILCTDSHQIGLNVRQGDWGEIISAEILEKIRGYKIPIYKLRWKDTKDKSMRGKADVVVYNISAKGLTIIFTEVKSRIKRESHNKILKCAENVNTGLSYINESFKPEIVKFIWDKLRFARDPDYNLLSYFEHAMKYPSSYAREFQVFFVFEKSIWQEDYFLKILNSKNFNLPNLTINIVLIDSMRNLIHETYDLVLKSAMDVVYNG